MKIGVVVFPGSNCDRDMMYALSGQAGVQVQKLWHKQADLQNCDVVVLPGGFSYGDYLRSGAIARFSPIMQAVVAHAKSGGRVLGVCNGFQILVEAGLLPGVLLDNTGQKFVCKNIGIRPKTTQTAFTKGLDLSKTYKIPVAHGQGRYYASADTLASLEDQDQILFVYHSLEGQNHINLDYNPNGSLLDIAGICNQTRNVFGLMPHPERAADAFLGNTDGIQMLKNLMEI